MRKIREILRLKYEAKLTNRQIAQSCNRARSTIATYLERAEKAGLRWPLPDEVDEDKLHELLFADTLPPAPTRPLPRSGSPAANRKCDRRSKAPRKRSESSSAS